MSGPTQTPANSSASLSPIKCLDHLPKLLVSKKAVATIKEISPQHPSVAQITTNFCFPTCSGKIYPPRTDQQSSADGRQDRGWGAHYSDLALQQHQGNRASEPH
jgi:hypothetical protein